MAKDRDKALAEQSVSFKKLFEKAFLHFESIKYHFVKQCFLVGMSLYFFRVFEVSRRGFPQMQKVAFLSQNNFFSLFK